MYGYVLPDKDNLSKDDYLMFQSLYCGICFEIKREYGQLTRFTTNYEIVTFGLIIIEICKCQIEWEVKRCIGNPKKKAVVRTSEFLNKLAAMNILLTYYKATDDEIDGGGKKRIARHVLKKPYKKAKLLLPKEDEIIAKWYNALREQEKQNCASVDIVADCFASLLADLIKQFAINLGGDVLPEWYNENFYKMCYNLGKFVYLADALDDVDDDAKSKNYNPFLAKYELSGKKIKRKLLDLYGEELRFALNSTINRAIECCNNLTFTHINDLIRNIMYYGLRKKADELFATDAKLKAPKF